MIATGVKKNAPLRLSSCGDINGLYILIIINVFILNSLNEDEIFLTAEKGAVIYRQIRNWGAFQVDQGRI
jgi:hypothetical protein